MAPPSRVPSPFLFRGPRPHRTSYFFLLTSPPRRTNDWIIIFGKPQRPQKSTKESRIPGGTWEESGTEWEKTASRTGTGLEGGWRETTWTTRDNFFTLPGGQLRPVEGCEWGAGKGEKDKSEKGGQGRWEGDVRDSLRSGEKRKTRKTIVFYRFPAQCLLQSVRTSSRGTPISLNSSSTGVMAGGSNRLVSQYGVPKYSSGSFA